jgi:hypothetical protein
MPLISVACSLPRKPGRLEIARQRVAESGKGRLAAAQSRERCRNRGAACKYKTSISTRCSRPAR